MTAKFNSEFLDLIKINWKSEREVCNELRATLKKIRKWKKKEK